MRPEDVMAIEVVLELAEFDHLERSDATLAEAVRQAVSGRARDMRREIESTTRTKALDDARVLVAKELKGVIERWPSATSAIREATRAITDQLGDMASE
jgi:hypothetical protein